MDKMDDLWGKILIVDDDEDVQSVLNGIVKPHALQVKTTGDIGSLSFLMRSFLPDIILLDMNFSQNKMDGSEGFACLEKIQQIDPDVVVLFITAYVDVDNVIKAVKRGVFDYITKPWDNGKLLATLASAWQMRIARLQNIRLRHSVEALTEMAKSGLVMIGESPAVLQVQRLISQVAKADPPVLSQPCQTINALRINKQVKIMLVKLTKNA